MGGVASAEQTAIAVRDLEVSHMKLMIEREIAAEGMMEKQEELAAAYHTQAPDRLNTLYEFESVKETVSALDSMIVGQLDTLTTMRVAQRTGERMVTLNKATASMEKCTKAPGMDPVAMEKSVRNHDFAKMKLERSSNAVAGAMKTSSRARSAAREAKILDEAFGKGSSAYLIQPISAQRTAAATHTAAVASPVTLDPTRN